MEVLQNIALVLWGVAILVAIVGTTGYLPHKTLNPLFDSIKAGLIGGSIAWLVLVAVHFLERST